jgi:hypothetical protein
LALSAAGSVLLLHSVVFFEFGRAASGEAQVFGQNLPVAATSV